MTETTASTSPENAVGRAVTPLQHLGGELFRCPVTARLYREQDGCLHEEQVP